MQRGLLILAAGCLLAEFPPALADSPTSGFRYPRVYGPTGRPYGPTQAHYQYQRQYGRPWHGEGGLTAGFGHGQAHVGHGHHGHGLNGHHQFHVPYGYQTYGYNSGYYGPGVGYGYGAVGPPGYADFGPIHSYVPAAPLVIQPYPLFYGSNPFDNSALREAIEENNARWKQPLAVEPVGKKPLAMLQPSTAAAKLKSLRSQANGDEWFRKTDYLQAYLRYKQAVAQAGDRPDPYFRLAMAYAGLGRYDKAVRELRSGLDLNPAWPTTGESLNELFGVDNQLAKTSVLGGVVDWAKEDIRDPDRLFLLGVMLHFNQDPRAGEVFETAYRLAGGGEHLALFLRPVDVELNPDPAAAPDGAAAAPDVLIPPLPGELARPADNDAPERGDGQIGPALPQLDR